MKAAAVVPTLPLGRIHLVVVGVVETFPWPMAMVVVVVAAAAAAVEAWRFDVAVAHHHQPPFVAAFACHNDLHAADVDASNHDRALQMADIVVVVVVRGP